MISYFNIPVQATTDTPISKKLFAEKSTLSTAEKRILREDIDRIVMKGLLQTRTIGIATYVDDEYAYDQIVFAQVDIRNRVKVPAIATMIQRAFPVPMFVILHHDDNSFDNTPCWYDVICNFKYIEDIIEQVSESCSTILYNGPYCYICPGIPA